MKVVLAGALGKLGTDILIELCKQGHEVVALDLVTKELEGYNYTAKKIDVTKPETLEGTMDGADVVISTVGLTGTSATITNYDIDFNGNGHILNEAKKSGLNYVIHRPTGYFYDIAKVFMPMIEKGEVTLLGKKDVSANVIDTPDFAEFIVAHMTDEKKMYNIGGKETYTYEELAKLFFAAAGKEPVIKRAPEFLFTVLAFVNKLKKNGKEAILKFSKWTLTNDLVGDTVVGEASFKEYIESRYKEEK